MEKYICLHGHFYQPPRENPWLEEIELQQSAYPYHDWNERINAECYAPNAASRIVGYGSNVIKIINNYSRMSFNFGPTLLSWMEKHAPDDYAKILEADQESQRIFSGHGSAIAQVYNHMIMPLANTRDERTQVYWGIKDFEYRFKRKPEGMWLAETAVNTETLEILAEHGITFTILAPRQARAIRKIGDTEWTSVNDFSVNTHMPYICHLPSGKSINIFFYHGPLSQEIAFNGLLKNGDVFSIALLSAFPEGEGPMLLNLATDGETYGHHKKFGDMALAYCLHSIKENNDAHVTIYAEYLEKFPAQFECQIVEDSSWSCVHGIGRWKEDCSCRTMHNGWNQQWRQPLRNALDWLRDQLAGLYEEHMKAFTDDPWKARDQYIDVILDRSEENIRAFLDGIARKPLEAYEKTTVLQLLEMQRHAMLMYTSCGWFFDEISGLETTQILKYAARAIQLGEQLSGGHNFENHFKEILKEANSNIPEYQNGKVIYERFVKTSTIDLLNVGAHYAISSLFLNQAKDVHEKRIYCFSVENEILDKKEAGKMKLLIGRANIRSQITLDEFLFSFAVLHLGDHMLNGGVRPLMGDEEFNQMKKDLQQSFTRSDIPETIRLMSVHFGMNNYSLRHLFIDEQKKIFEEIIQTTLQSLEGHFRQIYEHYYALMQAQEELQAPLPKILEMSVGFVLDRDLQECLQSAKIDLHQLQRLVNEITRWSLDYDRGKVSLMATECINLMMKRSLDKPQSVPFLKNIEAFMHV
ncbi:MAG: DUF3536 domain-containing protein, partial [Candidatus Omnitrophica bacterium]|nr:DUF3536 domain-containing protein [Candidatus Omnitrophota bacterium]